MTKKFTDGEWTVEDNGIIFALTPTDPAHKSSRYSNIVWFDNHTEESRANARLVTAAPLMYEKLQYALNALKVFAPNVDLVPQIEELLRCIDDEQQAEFIYDRCNDVYKVPLPDGRIMAYKLSALQKIILEHQEMKELLQEFYEVRRAESSATGRRVRAEHRLEDFLKSTEAKS